MDKKKLLDFLKWRFLNQKKEFTDDDKLKFNTRPDAWLDKDVPAFQEKSVIETIKNYKNGKNDKNFQTLLYLLDLIGRKHIRGTKILEIGCSSAYYSEVFSHHNLELEYSGCDLSPVFISMGRNKYPNLDLTVQDACSLDYSSGEFEIVVSGCCIQHIPNFGSAIAEACRVSNRYVIFHRTPVIKGNSHCFIEKNAYGVKMPEIYFSEGLLMQELEKNNLEIVEAKRIPSVIGYLTGHINKSILCKKIT